MRNTNQKTTHHLNHKATHGKILFVASITILSGGLIYHLGFGGSPIPALSGITLLSLHIFISLVIAAHGRKLMKANKNSRKGLMAGIMAVLHGHEHGAENTPHTEGMTIHWGRFYDVVVWLFFTGKEQIVRKQTVELAHIKPGDKVLDVGCGTGTLTLAAREKTGSAGEAHGIDSSPEMIDVASKKATSIGADIKFQVALIEAIPYPNGYFDVVLSSLMIHHLPSDALKQKAFSEMRRVLKPGGRIMIVDFEPPTGPLSRRIAALILGPDMMKSNVKAMHPMMKKAGFTEITSGGTKSKIISFTSGIVYDKSAWEGEIV